MRGINLFFLLIGVLVLIKFGIAFIPVDPTTREADVLSLSLTPLLIAIPVYAIFAAANHKWDWKLAAQFLVLGLIMHLPMSILEKQVDDRVLLNVFSAIGQTGLLIWTVGLGALLTSMIKDKNILIPVSIFLVAFDIFLVFTPNSPMQKLLAANPEYLSTIAYKLPQAGSVEPFAFIGPADFLFMGMFFVALYRFQMETRATAQWMVLAILGYLVLSFFTHSLPLMVPIGLTVLAVNWKHFKLTKQEIGSTAVIGLICAALVTFAAVKASQAGISTEVRDGAPEESEMKPAPGGEGQSPSGDPNAPEGTQDPQ